MMCWEGHIGIMFHTEESIISPLAWMNRKKQWRKFGFPLLQLGLRIFRVRRMNVSHFTTTFKSTGLQKTFSNSQILPTGKGRR